MGSIVGAFIAILVGVTLLPTVAQQVGIAHADGNITGAADTLIVLTILFFSLAIMVVIMGIIISAFRNSVLFGYENDDYDDDEYEDKDEEDNEHNEPINITISNTKTKKTSLGSPQGRKNL